MDVSDILEIIDDHGFSDSSEASKLAALNETYWEITGLEPWRFLEKRMTLNFDGSSATPSNWPTDFRALLKLKYPSQALGPRHIRLDDFEEFYGERATEVGTPELYYFEDDQLKVWPIPPAGNAVLRMPYLHWPPELTSGTAEANIVIPSRYHRGTLVNGAVQRLYMQDEDIEIAREFERLQDKAVQRMRTDLWVLQYDEPDFIHVVEDDGIF